MRKRLRAAVVAALVAIAAAFTGVTLTQPDPETSNEAWSARWVYNTYTCTHIYGGFFYRNADGSAYYQIEYPTGRKIYMCLTGSP